MITTTTPAQLAQQWNLKAKTSDGKTEYHGKNPTGEGAQDDGFILYPEGNAWDRKLDRRYTSWEVATLAGLKSSQYGPCADYLGQNGNSNGHANGNGASNGHAPYPVSLTPLQSEKPKPQPKPINPDDYDARSLIQRGLKPETLGKYGIVEKTHWDWGKYYEYPTYHPKGEQGRARIKILNPAKAKGDKYKWGKAQDGVTEPVGYNLNNLQRFMVDKNGEETILTKTEVWLLNGEPAVWLADQCGIPAVCKLRGEKSDNKEILQALYDLGFGIVHTVPDHDDTGKQAAATLATTKDKPRAMKIIVHQWNGVDIKKGYDFADFYEEALTFARNDGQTEIDLEHFQRNVWHLPQATEKEIAEWLGEEKEEPKPKGRPADARVEVEGEDEGEGKKGRPSALPMLMDELEKFEMFTTGDNEAFLVANIKGRDGRFRQQALNIQTAEFEHWLGHWAETLGVRMLPKGNIETLVRKALQWAWERYDTREVLPRFQHHNGRVYLNLNNAEGEVVEIGADIEGGWQIITDPPCFFRRSASAQPLCRPLRPQEHGTTPREVWAKFRCLLNAQDDRNWAMMVGWLVSSYRPPTAPYPALTITGEQDAGKTQHCLMLRELIDPNKASLTSLPEKANDLAISAINRFVLGFDNLSHIQQWQNDALCSIATIGSLVTRKLFTNREEEVFTARRPLLFNGIDAQAMGRPDLKRRCFAVHLPTMDGGSHRKKSEHELWAKFHELRPFLVANLCLACATALRNVAEVRAQNLNFGTGMADAGEWVVAAEDVLPWDKGYFRLQYAGNRRDASAELVSENTLAQAIFAWVREMGSIPPTPSSEVHATLVRYAAEAIMDKEAYAHEEGNARLRMMEDAKKRVLSSKQFPPSAAMMGRELNRLKPALRMMGVEATYERPTGCSVWSFTPCEPAPEDEVDIFEDDEE